MPDHGLCEICVSRRGVRGAELSDVLDVDPGGLRTRDQIGGYLAARKGGDEIGALLGEHPGIQIEESLPASREIDGGTITDKCNAALTRPL